MEVICDSRGSHSKLKSPLFPIHESRILVFINSFMDLSPLLPATQPERGGRPTCRYRAGAIAQVHFALLLAKLWFLASNLLHRRPRCCEAKLKTRYPGLTHNTVKLTQLLWEWAGVAHMDSHASRLTRSHKWLKNTLLLGESVTWRWVSWKNPVSRDSFVSRGDWKQMMKDPGPVCKIWPKLLFLYWSNLNIMPMKTLMSLYSGYN